MTVKTDEQERADFEAWWDEEGCYLGDISDRAGMFAAYQAGRAALQSQRINEGWKEAAIAWEVCASLHREYCKGKDPLFKTRQADFVKHAEAARAKALRPCIEEDGE